VVWLLGIPVLIIVEVVSLIRHPRTFSGLALVVFLVICSIGGLFLYRGAPLWWIYVTWVVGGFFYYFIKLYK